MRAMCHVSLLLLVYAIHNKVFDGKGCLAAKDDEWRIMMGPQSCRDLECGLDVWFLHKNPPPLPPHKFLEEKALIEKTGLLTQKSATVILKLLNIWHSNRNGVNNQETWAISADCVSLQFFHTNTMLEKGHIKLGYFKCCFEVCFSPFHLKQCKNVKLQRAHFFFNQGPFLSAPWTQFPQSWLCFGWWEGFCMPAVAWFLCHEGRIYDRSGKRVAG